MLDLKTLPVNQAVRFDEWGNMMTFSIGSLVPEGDGFRLSVRRISTSGSWGESGYPLGNWAFAGSYWYGVGWVWGEEPYTVEISQDPHHWDGDHAFHGFSDSIAKEWAMPEDPRWRDGVYIPTAIVYALAGVPLDGVNTPNSFEPMLLPDWPFLVEMPHPFGVRYFRSVRDRMRSPYDRKLQFHSPMEGVQYTIQAICPFVRWTTHAEFLSWLETVPRYGGLLSPDGVSAGSIISKTVVHFPELQWRWWLLWAILTDEGDPTWDHHILRKLLKSADFPYGFAQCFRGVGPYWSEWTAEERQKVEDWVTVYTRSAGSRQKEG